MKKKILIGKTNYSVLNEPIFKKDKDKIVIQNLIVVCKAFSSFNAKSTIRCFHRMPLRDQAIKRAGSMNS